MKSVHNLAEVAKLWREASEEEKRVWNEQAKMLNIFSFPIEKKPKLALTGYNQFVRRQSEVLRNVELADIAELWNELSPLEKGLWKEEARLASIVEGRVM